MDSHTIIERLKRLNINPCSEALENIKELSEETEIEGLYRLLTITNKNSQKNMYWSMPLKIVTVPIVINNLDQNYFLLTTQSRMIFSGKVTIEVYRGFINAQDKIDDSLLWNYLLGRKIPYLQDYVSIVKVVELGSFYQHPDISSNKMPIQLIFAKTKEPYQIDELKHNLKVKHEYTNEPTSGPPLHNNEPSLKSFIEIESRLNEIISSGEATVDEFYINDVFSITAIYKSLKFIKSNGYPF